MESQNSQQYNLIQEKAINKLGQISSIKFQNNNQILYYKNPVILNQQYTHDILPGVYQGGFQLWQCEIQFLKKIFQMKQFQTLIKNKSVIQIGCGHGLLGIAAAKLGAKNITLQDYNQNVIEELTQPTLKINNVNCQMNFLSGDWNSITNFQAYDLILGSQVTYRQQNYIKIINFIIKNMKKTGKCILANKNYYFGVGGNLSDFKTKLQQNGLEWKSICKIVPKSGGNKKQIIEISFKE